MQKNEVEQWISSGPEPKLMDIAKEFGEEIKSSGLTTSQIRQVFSKLKSIEAKKYRQQRTEFMMLKPFIAYAAGRQAKVNGLQKFKEKITWGINCVLDVHGDEIEEEKRFKNFCTFFEAILAYHRACGGK